MHGDGAGNGGSNGKRNADIVNSDNDNSNSHSNCCRSDFGSCNTPNS